MWGPGRYHRGMSDSNPPSPDNDNQPWNAAGSDRPLRRAGAACWVSGGLTMLLFGLLGVGLLVAGQYPPEQFADALAAQNQGAEAAEAPPMPDPAVIDSIPTVATVTGGLLLVLLFLPGAALTGLGAAVRGRRLWAVWWAIGTCYAIAALNGIFLSIWVLGVLVGGNVGALVPATVLAGLLALLWWTIRRLGEAGDYLLVYPGATSPRTASRAPRAKEDDEEDPWGPHRPRGL